MPMVPHRERESYRQWAKDNTKAQMDERAWVHESDYQEFMLRPEEPDPDPPFYDTGEACRGCDDPMCPHCIR